ncbi:ankyrin repeat domain-containing protein [Sphaerotilus sp.]|uniref:ankyrin repeat domain-containing protein n=1 Tax=Sphaerotilus sp. TaxID=2093942 RepID=UPI002ACD719E|nr:ankyrin repeat domain-containing protein [Sphaerotilus sp.]MDZ7855078.1 ankyrin repeat domain-containing protein [Sphaerotilus sp.]
MITTMKMTPNLQRDFCRLQFLIDTDGDSDSIRASLADGAPANIRGNQGRTALHVASARGDFVLIDELVQQGADPEAACTDGWTPACEAARFGQMEVLQRLHGHGATIDSARVLNELQKHEQQVHPPQKILRPSEAFIDLRMQVDVECHELARVVQAELRVGCIWEDSQHSPFGPRQGFVEIDCEGHILMRAETSKPGSLHSPVSLVLQVRRDFWNAGFFPRLAVFHPDLEITGLSHEYGGWLFGKPLKYLDGIESVARKESLSQEIH